MKRLGITELMQVDGVLEEEINEIIKRKNPKLDLKMRNKLIKFFKGLLKEGVEVYLEEKDYKGMITDNDAFILNGDLKYIYKEYVHKTINAIIKEIERVQKEDEKRDN